ncbi:MAG: Plasmid stabilization system protein [Rhodospirillales bacterium]|nr:Plasmid stabilization system protein [Rhodospirillales bacterium]
MARYRLSVPAKADIASVLRVGQATHGSEARVRYRGLLTAALRRIAADPAGPPTVDRGELFAGLRGLHIRHASAESREAPVRRAVHVIFYRAVEPEVIEIVRVLHERMEPSLHLAREGQ